jgi:RNA polymerase sigma factor (sigma-70 family)
VSAVNPLHEIVRQETAARVRRAIRQLPPKQRATLVLRVYHELSHDEIARVLGGTVGAAKANLFHALGNLKRLIEP